MKNDISSRNDIEQLVIQFYEAVRADDMLGPIFSDIAHTNWDTHIPIMVNFWENAIFYNGAYTGNPMETHRHLHRIFPLNEEHFNRWLSFFTNMVDTLFEGEHANAIKQKAFSISTVMKMKLIEKQKQESEGL
jgi:hemoglobin